MKYIEKTLNNTISLTGIVNLHFFEFPKEFYTQKECHPFYELLYVVSGYLFINSEDYTGILKKGQIILHRPNEQHALSCNDDSAPTVIIIGFNCDNSSIDSFSKCPTNLNSAETKNLAEIIKEGRNVFSPPYDIPTYDMKKKNNIILGAEQILKIMIEYFLIRLLRNNNLIIEKNENKKQNENLSITEITSYLDQNYVNKVSIDELAFLFNTNRSTICKEFKNNTGKTIKEYINDTKLTNACDFLIKTNKTITSISNELGYESIHYFTRFFKKKYGLSPNEFRKQNKK